MSRWEGCRAAAPSLRSPGRAHLLTTRCAGGGIPPSGRERALSEGVRFLREAAGCGLLACAAARAFLLRKETKQWR